MIARHTIVWAETYLRDAERLLTKAEQDWVEVELSTRPEKQPPMSGGLRKLRVARGSRGKSKGARVIYYFEGEDGRVLVFAIFAKNEAANLTKAEQQEIIKAIKAK